MRKFLYSWNTLENYFNCRLSSIYLYCFLRLIANQLVNNKSCLSNLKKKICAHILFPSLFLGKKINKAGGFFINVEIFFLHRNAKTILFLFVWRIWWFLFCLHKNALMTLLTPKVFNDTFSKFKIKFVDIVSS